MAIKGKSKTRGKPKVVTPGPRPAYVPVTRPWWQKRGFWIGVVVVLAVGSVAGIGYGLAKERTHQREQELAKRMENTGTEFVRQIDPIVQPLGQALPPTSFDALPQLKEAFDDFAKGAIRIKDVENTAKGAAVQAKLAYEKLDAIDVSKLFGGKGFTAEFVSFALNARSKMITSLKLFEQAAQMAVLAARLDGDTRDELIARAQSVTQIAQETFRDGYADYVEVQVAANILRPTPLLPPGSTDQGGS